ncbi:unnamed protein product [Arctia plantaginis]|uniref:Uncharacterized protein n=1 Tax=Arctia plantaginis TaxID=874455 RepID=A0A8S1BUG5_ARCPL|nr:unnamed protein product [Arctia plantaginis]
MKTFLVSVESEPRSKAVRTPPPGRYNVHQQRETPEIELQQSIRSSYSILSYATVARKPADIISAVNTWVEVSSQLSDAQQGLCAGRGTTGNLLHLMSRRWTLADMVDNDVLLTQMAAVGFTPHVLAFISRYLLYRCQYVDWGDVFLNRTLPDLV